MRIGFWNIAQNRNSALGERIVLLAETQDLDILLLLECKIPPNHLLGLLNPIGHSNYFWSPASFSKESYFQVFSKLRSEFSQPILEEKRVQARRIIDPAFGDFTLVMVHYQSRRHWSETDQNAHATELRVFIDEVEHLVGHDRTVVIGDFNMNPFQPGMVQTTGLHTTMDRRIAASESRIVDEKTYKFFYNPMWSFFGEQGKGDVNGTYFYRSANPLAYFWNIFDQVILRPSLLETFKEESLEILTKIDKQNLLNANGVIDKTISDHLPIVFELNLNKLTIP